MMLFQYIIKIYIYLVDMICPSTYNSKIKHKNSEDIQYSMEEDIIVDIDINIDKCVQTSTSINHDQYIDSTYNVIDENMDRYGQIPVLKARSKKQNIPVYMCGYCHLIIRNPVYMYNDLAFCTVACRTQQITLDKNTTFNSSTLPM